MYLQKMTRRNPRTGTKHWHFCLVKSVDGIEKRTYVKKCQVRRIKLEVETHRRAKRTLSILKRKLSKGSPGPHPRIGGELRQLLHDAGYATPHGLEVPRSRKRFFRPETAVVRFSMLADELRTIVGSAENLLSIELGAKSLMLSRRRRGEKGASFESSFRDVLEAFIRQ